MHTCLFAYARARVPGTLVLLILFAMKQLDRTVPSFAMLKITLLNFIAPSKVSDYVAGIFAGYNEGVNENFCILFSW